MDFEQELYRHFGQVKDFTFGMQIGKYFYELGKQEKPTPAEGLEEEIKRYYEDMDGDCRYVQTARHFARWQKEQMMKEAVEADVNIYRDLAEGESWAEFVVAKPPKNLSDKVRIIIVKED